MNIDLIEWSWSRSSTGVKVGFAGLFYELYSLRRMVDIFSKDSDGDKYNLLQVKRVPLEDRPLHGIVIKVLNLREGKRIMKLIEL